MKCSVCKSFATSFNREKQPVCSKHLKSKVSVPMCPECGLTMAIRQGKFGSFWGCIAFPGCDGMKKI
jgi:ssDNA-binding Zn-finger/Zn-ribbon topoisomerase 1